MTSNYVVSFERVSELYRSAETKSLFKDLQAEFKTEYTIRPASGIKALAPIGRAPDVNSTYRPTSAKLPHSGYALAHTNVSFEVKLLKIRSNVTQGTILPHIL